MTKRQTLQAELDSVKREIASAGEPIRDVDVLGLAPDRLARVNTAMNLLLKWFKNFLSEYQAVLEEELSQCPADPEPITEQKPEVDEEVEAVSDGTEEGDSEPDEEETT